MSVRDDLLRAQQLLTSAIDAAPKDRAWRLALAHGLLTDVEDDLWRELAAVLPDMPARQRRPSERPAVSAPDDIENCRHDNLYPR